MHARPRRDTSEPPLGARRRRQFADQELEDSGIALTHLQPVYNMQNIIKLARAIPSQGALLAPMKDGAVSMVDARDIAAVAAECLTGDGHAGQTYLVTGPEGITFVDVAARLSQGLGVAVPYVDAAIESARIGMLKMGMPEWYVEDLLGFYAWYASGASSAVSDVVARLTKQPGRAFAQFVEEHRAELTITG